MCQGREKLFIQSVCSGMGDGHSTSYLTGVHFYKTINAMMYEGGRINCSYDNFIFAVDDFFDLWDPSIVISMEKVCEAQGRKKIEK